MPQIMPIWAEGGFMTIVIDTENMSLGDKEMLQEVCENWDGKEYRTPLEAYAWDEARSALDDCLDYSGEIHDDILEECALALYENFLDDDGRSAIDREKISDVIDRVVRERKERSNG